MKCKRFLLCAISFLLLGVLTTQAEDLAKYADKVEADQGLCVLLGDPDGQVAQKLAEQTHLLVYVQLPSAEKVLAAREAAERAGIGLDQLHIAQGPPDRILLGDNLVDLVLEAGAANDVPETEVLRVLRPRGLSVNSSGEIVKPVPDGIDDWTHLYHSPDNNTQSLDTQARAPYLTQFIANPQYAPAPQAAVAAGGRVFKAYGNVAWHEREEPYLNTLVAYNGYNGSVLWKHSLPDGMMVHRSTFIATPDTVFVGDDQSCKLLDAVTGQLREEIKPPTELAGGTFWKWMALQDDVLYALIGQQEMKDEAKRWRRQAHGWPWNEISRGHNQPVQSWGFGNDLLAIDPNTKKVLWHYHEDEPIDARATCMSSNRVFAFRFDAYLTCLDATTGEVVWRRTKENSPELFDTLGRQLHRQGWDTNWRTVAFMKCNEDALFFAGPQLSKLLVVSTEDGRVLWEDPYDNYQLVIRPEGLYAISGPWGKNVSRKFDPLTGEVLAELPVGRRACTRPTGTCDSILFRAMGGSVRYDVASAQPRWVSPMRPPCHDGVTVANGQLYWWPYVCDCQLSLYGVTCLGSAGSFDFQPDATPADRLETVDASGVDPVDPSPNDWPTFRANSRANVTSNARIPTKARELWETKPSLLDGVWPTAPVAAGGMVYLAGTDGVIRATRRINR